MKFNIIYADCPWQYFDAALAGQRGAGCKYPLLSIPELCKLPINEIAAKDSILFMWVTMPQLNVVMEVIEAWGFSFKTCGFTWLKLNPKSGTPFFSMGRYTRGNCELCLIATKGKPKVIDHSISQVIMTPVEKHSKKPDIVRDKIVQLMGDLPRIELFARQSVTGWTCLGNDIDGKDIRDSLREIIELKDE